MSHATGVTHGQALYPSVEQWKSYMQAIGRSERTVVDHSRVVCVVAGFAGVPPEQLTADQVLAWLGSKRGSKPATLSTYTGALRSWFKWCVRFELRADDPMTKIDAVRLPPGTPRPLTDAQVKHLLSAVRRTRMRAYLTLAAYQGLRVHEIAKIRGEDVDELAGSLRVVGKGGVVADLPLHPYTVEVAKLFPEQGPWFPSYLKEGLTVSPNSVSHAISMFMEAHGVVGTAHQLRHWYATTLLQGGTDVRVVQSLMRHANIATTVRYTRVNRRQQQEGMARLPLLVHEELAQVTAERDRMAARLAELEERKAQ